MRVTSVEQIKRGDIIYKANCFQDNPRSISVFQVIDPIIDAGLGCYGEHLGPFGRVRERGYWHITTTGEWNFFGYNSTSMLEERSWTDAGVIPNNYNNHQTFTTLLEACQYLKDFSK